jgi:hypothetical protein
MFHMKWLDDSMVCLFALHLAYVVGKEQIPAIAIADPYYMHEHNLISCEGHGVMMKYIEDFMVKNKNEEIMLLPYFPT